MGRHACWAIGFAAGCLQTAGGGGFDDDDLVGGADADTDADDVGDADADADGAGDADVDTGTACPAYPSGPYGLRQGQVVQDFSLPGNDTDAEWTMTDFWCMGQEDGKKVLILNIHSMT
jgi:hypothetical protein